MQSARNFLISAPLTNDITKNLEVNVVTADVLFFVELEIFKTFVIYATDIYDRLYGIKFNLKISLIRKRGYIQFERDKKIR